MSYEINRIKDIELSITELQKELDVLKEISVMIPGNDREHIIQLYLTGSSLTDIYEDFKNRDYRPCELYPTTTNLLSIMINSPPTGQVTQEMIDLVKLYFYQNKGRNNCLSVTIPIIEKARYLKYCKKLGYKDIADFTRKALKLQFAVALSNIQSDEDFEEVLEEF